MTELTEYTNKQPSLFGNSSEFPELRSPDNIAESGYIRAYQHEDPKLDKVAAIDILMWAKDADYPIAQGLLENYKHDKSTSVILKEVEKLKALAPDGKMRKTDFLTLEQAYDLVLKIPGKQSDALRKYLISLGVERYEESRVPGSAVQNARRRDLALLQSMGYEKSEAAKRLQQRIEGVDNFKLLMDAVKRVCENPQFGQVVNAEYINLFGETADRLKEILETKSIREKLPELQYSYLQAAESSIRTILKHQDHLTMEQILHIVETVVKPLGELLNNICDAIGIHHITGQPLTAGSKNILVSKGKQLKLPKGSN